MCTSVCIESVKVKFQVRSKVFSLSSARSEVSVNDTL